MLHICPRVHGQSFIEPPFEEEILAFICFLGHSAIIRNLTYVNINMLYHPWRSFAAIINKYLTGKISGYDSLRLSQAQILWGLYHKRNIDYAYLIWEDFDPSISKRNKVNWHYVKDDHMFSTIKLVSRHQNMQRFDALLPIELTNEEIRNSNAYKEYYAVATGAAPPKPKATKASKAKSLSSLSEMKELVLYQGFPMYPLMSLRKNSPGDDEGKDGDGDDDDNADDGEEGDGDDDDEDDDGEEGDDDDQEVVRDDDKDDEEEGGDDKQEYDEEEYDEETKDEESFDPIPKTPKNSDDKGNDEDDLGLNVGREEGHNEEEEEDKLYRDVNINKGRGLQTTQEVEDSHVTLTQVNHDDQKENDEFLKTIDENMQNIIKEKVKEQVKVQVSKILPRIEQTMNEKLEADVLTRSSHSSKTSYVVAANLSEMELKKILIKKTEGNKSIQCSDEQRNLYKALRHRDDDADKDEEPFARPDRGSKRRKKGKEPESASAPMETATRSAGRLTQGTKSRQASAKEVYKAITDQLDWVNPEGEQYPHNLIKPLPLIPNNRGRRVIPFEHFINNDLEYLRGGASSRKYTTSITKTKAADYGHIKWIEDLVPRTMWIKEPIGYDKHSLWGASHWGRKR
nr:hypothetical protein [Tanacetum cinerariifolium]